MNLNEVSSLKTKAEKINYLMDLPFEAKISQRSNKYFLTIGEISLIASADTIQDAFSILNEKKKNYFKDMIELGSEEDIVLACSKKKSQFYMNDLKSSLIKYCALFILITGTLGIGSCTARNIVLGGITKLPKIIERERKQISTKMKLSMKKISNSTPEEKEERVKKFEKSLNEIRPYIIVLKNAFK